MKHWIEKREVLAAFSDPAGAKAVLAYLYTYGNYAKTVTVISDRIYGFYKDFGYEVRLSDQRSASEWIAESEVLIAGTSYPSDLEFELVDAAFKARIPSISFVDHWTNILVRYERNGRRVLPDVIGLVNEQAREQAEREGLPSKNLEVVGNPYHAYLLQWRPQESREKLLASMGLNLNNPYVLYAPEPFSQFELKQKYGFDEIDGLNLIFKAKQALNNEALSVVIKGHPNQDHRLFEVELAKSNNQDIIYVSEGDFNLLCYHAVAVLGFYSNALVEASLLGKTIIRPLILLNPNITDSLRSVKSEKWFDVFSEDDFINILRLLIYTEK
jgi:hypothetical protein